MGAHPAGAARRRRGPGDPGGGRLNGPAGRILALDYGRRRIGVAVTDPLRTIATPHSVVERREPGVGPPPALLTLIEELEPTLILVGIPVHMDGTEGEMATEAHRFAALVRAASGIPVDERDERLTSFEAERRLRELGLPRRARRDRGRTDMLAAAVLLEDYLAER